MEHICGKKHLKKHLAYRGECLGGMEGEQHRFTGLYHVSLLIWCCVRSVETQGSLHDSVLKGNEDAEAMPVRDDVVMLA